MNTPVTPYRKEESKKEQVREMFDNISPRYDLLNDVLSLGIARHWRRKALRMALKNNPALVLDVATGTGDLAFEALKHTSGSIIGVDISEGMLDIARQKAKERPKANRIRFETGDAENLPHAHNTFDTVIVSFGVRNFGHLQNGLVGINKVLKPGGNLMVLEFSQPEKTPFKQLYAFYSRFILPFIGRLISKDHRAYTYLPESVAAFPYGEAFKNELHQSGFREVKIRPLTFGICTIYSAVK
jgi:demethylmenaquinone methyltransferase/2-methoxy-6-polyprenyl-1,4-benzoquinol methylase